MRSGGKTLGQRYAEFAPSPRLAREVRCIWIFEADASRGEPLPERIVPDGRPELIVHFGEPFLETLDGRETRQPRAVFAGQISRPLWLRPGGAAGVLGVRFHAFGARKFLGMPLLEHTDARVGLADLWPREARVLSEALGETRSDAQRLAIAEAFVTGRCSRQRKAHDAVVSHCVSMIEGGLTPSVGGERLSIDSLVSTAGIGARQLERRFLDAVGVPPRLLASILRFRRVFDAIEHGPARWTDAALAAGYFDQSHLIRDFRRFAGCTPGEFLRDRPGLASALIEGDGAMSETYNPAALAKR
jgi:AraC-like DNA-binding protein